MAISPRDRFAGLFDGGIFVEIDVPQPVTDPLGFKDQKKYLTMKAAQKKTDEKEAMLIAEGDMSAPTSLPRPKISVSLVGRWECMLTMPLLPPQNVPLN